MLCPENKDYKTVTLRSLFEENIDSHSALKELIFEQCERLNPLNMEVGYFIHSKKVWINSRLDINDIWKIVEK